MFSNLEISQELNAFQFMFLPRDLISDLPVLP